MDDRSIALRPAEATLDEGMAYARFLDQAAEGFFQIMLGRRALEIIAAAFVQPSNDYSYQNVKFAERQGVVVGMASSFTAGQRRSFSKQVLERAAGRWHLRMIVVATVCSPALRIIDTIPDGDFYLQAIAVDAELRGQGVGSALIDEVEKRAAGSRSTRLSLDVSAKNSGARRLYERRGMAVQSQWPQSRLVPPLFFRMSKRL